MIIGYDFWADGVFYDEATTSVVIEDNDGVAFDNCNTLNSVNDFSIHNGTFDELNITKDSSEIDNSTEKTEWAVNNVLLAKFQNNLMAGTIGINGYNISQIEVKKKKKDDAFWQTYFTIDYNESINVYTIIDKFIESGEDYEYCICPVALDNNNNVIYGNNTTPHGIYIEYDNAHIFDNTASFDLIYNIKIGELTNQIGANAIETLGSQYPYVIYGQSNYQKGKFECLLVSEESATGEINIKSEKKLREFINKFLTNKQYKIIKNADGIYMPIMITGTPTLIPNNDLIGIYQISFEFVQVGNANDVGDLHNCGFNFEYFEDNTKITKTLSTVTDDNDYDNVDITEYIKKQLDKRIQSVTQLPNNEENDVLYLIQQGDTNE